MASSLVSTSVGVSVMRMPPPDCHMFFSGFLWLLSAGAGAAVALGPALRPKTRVLTISAKVLIWPITSPWSLPVSSKFTRMVLVATSTKRASVLMLPPKTVRLP